MKHTFFRRCRQGLLTGSLLAAFVSIALALPGDLDTSFGTNGVFAYDSGSTAAAVNSSVILPDGRIILAGYAGEGTSLATHFPTLERLLPRGVLDPSFGTGGAIRFTFPGEFESVTFQPDGKILVAGTAFVDGPNPAQYLLIRCNADGSLDTTFNLTGKVVAQFVAGMAYNSAAEVMVRRDGRIVLAGSAGTTSATSNFAATQYLANGVLDATFGNAGVRVVPNTSFANSAALQPDGKLVIAGTPQFTLARLLSDGLLDNTFGLGSSGVITNLGPAPVTLGLRSIKLQPDGKIVAAGRAVEAQQYDVAVQRFHSFGSGDQNFIAQGYSPNPPDDYGSDVAIESDGKVIVAGWRSPNQFLIRRYRTNGLPDQFFGQSGTVTPSIPFSINGTNHTVEIQPDGKIIVAGTASGATISHIVIRLRSGERAETVRFDFDGDGKSDLSTFRPSNSIWNVRNSGFPNANQLTSVQWGTPTDKLVPADYDGDGRTNTAVYRDGAWKIIWPDGSYRYAAFGQVGDLPRPGDFDGDGKADIAVWRPSNGIWYWLNSSNGQYNASQFGTNGDIPLIADFDADGVTDLAVFRPSAGNWYYLRSTDGQYAALHFGSQGDIPMPADFDGDRKTDLAVYRPSTRYWYRLTSSNGQYSAVQFGAAGDIPATGDYDGDTKADIVLYRPSNSVWYVIFSYGEVAGILFGEPSDKPIPSVYAN